MDPPLLYTSSRTYAFHMHIYDAYNKPPAGPQMALKTPTFTAPPLLPPTPHTPLSPFSPSTTTRN